MTEAAALLKLRDDAYWSASSTAITAITHRGSSTIPASAADQWMDRLAPHLTGRYSIEDFVQPLNGDRRTFVRKLLRALIDKGVVSEIDSPEPADSPTPEINLLGYLRSDPSAAYEAWCGIRTVIIGDATLAAHIAAACTRSGIRSVLTADTEDGGAEAVRALVGDRQVVHVVARDDIQLVTRMENRCDGRDVPLTQVVLDGEFVWIALGAGFTSVHGRLRRPTMGSPRRHVSHAAETILANHVAQTMMRSRAMGPTASGENRLTRFVWESLSTSSHRFVPVPGGRSAATRRREDFGSRLATLLAADPLSPESFSRKAARLTDDLIGVFDKITEGSVSQLPLRVSYTTYSVPGRGAAGEPRRFGVWGVGPDPVEARHAAASEAIRGYCSQVVDEDRLFPPDGRPLVVDDDAHRPALGELMVDCFDLLTSTPRTIAASEVFPERSDTTSYRPAVGVATGLSLERAIVNGLVDLCRQSTVAGLAFRKVPCSVVEIEQFTSDPVVEYCSTMLAAARATVELYDVTSDELRVPAIAVVIDGVTAAYGCGVDATNAVSDGLLTATTAWQSQVSGEPGYAPVPVKDLPHRLRGDTTTTGGRVRALSRRDLAETLARGGRSMQAVVLDHDPAVFDVLPVVRVITR